MSVLRLASAVPLLLVAEPASAHDWYEGLVSPGGIPCCSRNDCRVVPYRLNRKTGQEEVQVDGQWWPVDPRTVPDGPAPDGKVHACWYFRPKPPHSTAPDRPIFRCIILPRMTSLATLPARPFLACDHDGSLVSTVYMFPIEDLTNKATRFDDLASPGGQVDHVYVNLGHLGVEMPHAHVVLWHVPATDEARVAR